MLAAGYGEPGVYVGAYVPEFRRLGRAITNLGAQWTDGGLVTAGFQYAGASDVTSAFQNSPDAQQFSTRSFAFATSRQCGQPLSVQCASNGEHTDAVTPRRLVRRPRAVGPLRAIVRAVLARAGPARGATSRGERRTRRLLPRVLFGSAMALERRCRVHGSGEQRCRTAVDVSQRRRALPVLSRPRRRRRRKRAAHRFNGLAGLDLRREHMARADRAYAAQLRRSGERQETLLNFNQTWNTPAGTRLDATIGVGRFTTTASATQGSCFFPSTAAAISRAISRSISTCSICVPTMTRGQRARPAASCLRGRSFRSCS